MLLMFGIAAFMCFSRLQLLILFFPPVPERERLKDNDRKAVSEVGFASGLSGGTEDG